MRVIENKYDIGEIVYITTDPEQSARMIIEIIVTKGDVMYRICCGTQMSVHYEFEINSEVNTLAKL